MNTHVGEAKLQYAELVIPRKPPVFLPASKRIVDILLCAALTPVALVLGLPIALAVKLDGGPVFYSQKRVGLYGEDFDCIKFRSMVCHADDCFERMLEADPEARREWNEFQKLKNDPRVTRVGKFIRALSLDEIPQLINVLRGDMSFVGPRPIMASQIELYGDAFGTYCSMRPGITGVWQVSGRNNKTFADRVALDCGYAKSWSHWKDFAVILRTLPAVLSRKGAR